MRERVQMIAAGTVLAVIALGASAVPAQTQTPATPHMNMMAQAAAQDTEIAKLTEQMNRSTGQAKVEAMAQLLNALVQDRTRMHDQMQMMQHMHEMMMQGNGTRGDSSGQMHHPPADAK